jgi:pimeloyl-ACP methyl ester carboxylesterase
MRSLLYLHGVGDDGSRLDWLEVLGLGDQQPVAPDYSDLLVGDTPPVEVQPPRTASRSSPDDVDRRIYRSWQAQRHEELRLLGSTSSLPDRQQGFARVPDFIDAIAERLVTGFLYEQVGHYTNDEVRRQAIRLRIVNSIPAGTDQLVVVAHSLGALVALDLVQNLPDGLEISLLVTAASALARRQVPDHILQLRHEFPYGRVHGWVNVYNTSDAVTRGLPIGPRFPQAIDVSVSASIGDHSLATCLADPGVSQVIRQAITGSQSTPQSQPTDRPDSLSRDEAMQLAVVQMTLRMEDLLAARPDTTPEDLAKFHEARRLVAESFQGLSGQQQAWERDNSQILKHHTAEKDVPAILIRLTAADPMRLLQVHVPKEIDREARIQAAVDIGLPPSWIDLARKCLDQVEKALPTIGEDAEPEAEVLGDREQKEARDVTTSLRLALSGLDLQEALPRVRYGVADLRPVMSELVTRALVADRLGSPSAGSEERDALSQLMVTLGVHRAKLGQMPESGTRLASQLRRRTASVAQGLTWLAAQGIGLRPIPAPENTEPA